MARFRMIKWSVIMVLAASVLMGGTGGGRMTVYAGAPDSDEVVEGSDTEDGEVFVEGMVVIDEEGTPLSSGASDAAAGSNEIVIEEGGVPLSSGVETQNTYIWGIAAMAVLAAACYLLYENWNRIRNYRLQEENPKEDEPDENE